MLRARNIRAATFAASVLLAGSTAWSSSHREAPLTALDEKADITDFYAFVSYDDASKVTFIMNVDPLLEPGNGPNYFPFDPEVTYAIHVDNDHDARADVSFRFRFQTEIRAPGLFTGFAGVGGGVTAPANAPAPLGEGTLIIPPAITALDGPGSEGLNLRQSYSVVMKRHAGNGRRGGDRRSSNSYELGNELIAVPSNVGPRTMPEYAALADSGIYRLPRGMSVFAGAVDDPFYIDLGAAFDTLNLRQTVAPGALSEVQDGAAQNLAPDEVSGYNVNSIAIEVPIALLTRGGQTYAPDEAGAVIGSWATTSRPRAKSYGMAADGSQVRTSRRSVQVQRLGNPLVNEGLIGTGSKDQFSRSKPRRDEQFAEFLLDPLLARVVNAATGGAVAIPAPPRLDLLPLVQYLPPICPGCSTEAERGPIADLLRLNTAIPPTAAGERSRLGVLAGDLAGFPNGRRVSDDVVDIALRVIVGGVLAAPFEGYNADINSRLGDGVNVNDVAYRESFPYLGYAHSGRNSRHVDPGEVGCGDLATCPVE